MTTVSHTPAGAVLRIERGRRWASVEVDRIPLMTLARLCVASGCPCLVRPPAVRCPIHEKGAGDA